MPFAMFGKDFKEVVLVGNYYFGNTFSQLLATIIEAKKQRWSAKAARYITILCSIHPPLKAFSKNQVEIWALTD